MIAVIFEAVPRPGKKAAYLDIAARLRPGLERSIFADYRLRVAQVLRDYGLNDRGQVPDDSLQQQGEGDAGGNGLHP